MMTTLNSSLLSSSCALNGSSFVVKPLSLTLDKITLRPMVMQDANALLLAGRASQLWRWVQPNHCASLVSITAWIETSLAAQARGEHVPFVIIDNETQVLIGSIRFCSIRAEDRNLEIGFTFIKPEFHRTYANTQAKLLLLTHAFEALGAIRVEFKTHENNQQSRLAILRLGATFEGILRHQRILDDGTLRNTALFSIFILSGPGLKNDC
ncbi:GNAT family N-acetyltransferase [Shewanella surugensis]|uniref:GNAT family N-acetyltransferase n=1 Tax=Shewanella surugensis TaxID=212020 RepID=A0ABT0LIR9_9GAMM|nr:GNAT family protein [Shewanella surugensis]MCL1127593.1 GNAT family N-acetyltransferase [Shewanella surugensis]